MSNPILNRNESLKAIMEGHTLECQVKEGEKWHTMRESGDVNPISHPHLRWRIKKPDWVIAYESWIENEAYDVDPEDGFKAGYEAGLRAQK
ncbi:hypothetical protein [Alteromonas sp. RKMC-009]|uniref:hypothetical protein n=1 Tax=Alteromonas sp. RKMC-009 TaxID=2267264 RepID=UPI000E68CCEA|nr:hypothetical protein [Alteromonas sp. RKMC-009]AYA64304.1 hypothetical protein DS731_10015 [Alteromonas sp. RKMC-009]